MSLLCSFLRRLRQTKIRRWTALMIIMVCCCCCSLCIYIFFTAPPENDNDHRGLFFLFVFFLSLLLCQANKTERSKTLIYLLLFKSRYLHFQLRPATIFIYLCAYQFGIWVCTFVPLFFQSTHLLCTLSLLVGHIPRRRKENIKNIYCIVVWKVAK